MAELPPLVLGTATFTAQYNPDPYALPTTAIVHHALAHGVRAFDTSPYYGPAEELLGRALDTPYVRANHPRHSFRLLSKVGRLAGSSFDYSPAWIRQSVRRSLARLRTTYLDVVFCHDVEFVAASDVVAAVRELRRIRDELGTVRHIGISGYPVPVLCELAERVLRETGDPLDCVMSYAHFTLQNTALVGSDGLQRLVGGDAQVPVVLNASPLGMGLLRREGVPVGAMGDFHPSSAGLRGAIREASAFVDGKGERIEQVAMWYALHNWAKKGAVAGTSTVDSQRIGVSVVGVSSVAELDDILGIWAGISSDDPENAKFYHLAERVREILGSRWIDYSWASPPPDFVNTVSQFPRSPAKV